MFFLAAAAAAAGVSGAATAAATIVAGEGENDEDGDDYPDKALVVVEKSAKTAVIHIHWQYCPLSSRLPFVYSGSREYEAYVGKERIAE